MINKAIIYISIFVLSCCHATAQDEINYQPYSLKKELAKVKIYDYSTIKELYLLDSSATQSQLMGKYFLIKQENSELYKYIYVGRVNTCRSGICNNSTKRNDDSFSEYFDYFIIFDINKSIRVVKVFNYQASHGHEITNKGWLKQFAGFNGNQALSLGKNVDAISGATISADAIVSDIQFRLCRLKEFK